MGIFWRPLHHLTLLLLAAAAVQLAQLPAPVAGAGPARKTRMLLQDPLEQGSTAEDLQQQETAVAAAAAATACTAVVDCQSCHVDSRFAVWTCDFCQPGSRRLLANPSQRSVYSCAACKAGTFSAGGTRSVCATCPIGSYAGDKASMCKKCAAGFTTSKAGCSSPINCTVIPGGGAANPFLTPPELAVPQSGKATYAPEPTVVLSNNTRLINPSITIIACDQQSLTVSVVAGVDLTMSLKPGHIIAGVVKSAATTYADQLPCTAVLRKVMSVARLPDTGLTKFRIATDQADAFSVFDELSYPSSGNLYSPSVPGIVVAKSHAAGQVLDDAAAAGAAVPAGVFGDWGHKTFTLWPDENAENSALKLQVESDVDFDVGDFHTSFHLHPLQFSASLTGTFKAGATLKAILDVDKSVFQGNKPIFATPTLWDKVIYIYVYGIPVPSFVVGIRAAMDGGWAITGVPERFEADLGFEIQSDITLGVAYNDGLDFIHDVPSPEPQLIHSLTRLPCSVSATTWVTPRVEVGFSAYKLFDPDAFDDDWFGICRASGGIKVMLESKATLHSSDPAVCDTCKDLSNPRAQLAITPSLAADLEIRATGHVRKIIQLFTDTVSLHTSLDIHKFDPQQFCFPVPVIGTLLAAGCCDKPGGVPDPASRAGDYIGCFSEPWGEASNLFSRPMVPLGQVLTKAMTLEGCADLASRRGYLYFAVQFGRYCFGSNDISAYTTPGLCSMPCAGDTGQVCGGSMANSIYAVKPPPTDWTCQVFPPDGWAAPVRVNAYGDVECMSNNGYDCYWKDVPGGGQGELDNCKDLALHEWEGHPTVPGHCDQGGYNTPNHFCRTAKYRLTPWTCVFYPWNSYTTIQRINNAGLIECLSLDGKECFWWGPPTRADMAAAEAARRNCVSYLRSGLRNEPNIMPVVCTPEFVAANPNAFICRIDKRALTSTAQPLAVESIDQAINRGCWYDASARALPNMLLRKQICFPFWPRVCVYEKMTALKCVLEAKRLGYRFAAVQNGDQCFAGNDEAAAFRYGPAYDPWTATDPTSPGCTTPCNGWSGDFPDAYNCGGPWANSIYELAAGFPAAAAAASTTADDAESAVPSSLADDNTAAKDAIAAAATAAQARVVFKVASPADMWAAGPDDARP